MKLRLRSEIEKARALAAPEERDQLVRALEQLELARIGTIHAFCGDLLHERPVEAGIDPLFEVAAEEEAEAIADEAFEGWFQRTLADPPEGVRRILRRRLGRQSPREQLRSAMRGLREHRDFPEPWRRDAFDRSSAIDALMDELAQLGKLATASSWPDDYLTRNLVEIARFVEETTRIEAVRGRDYDGLEAALRDLSRLKGWRWKGAPRTTFGDLSRVEVLARRDQAKADLEAFISANDADLAPLLHEALQVPIAEYEVLKAKAGRLDFLDLLIKARDLIRDDAGVRHELQQRFTHFFVDEFQDTDPLQAEILILLAADDTKMRQPSIHKGAPLPVAAKFCVAVVTAALALAVMSARLFAGEQSATPPAPTASSSSLMDRETLTGGWFDADPLLRNHGVNLAACLTQFYGGLIAGDVRTTGNTAASWTPSSAWTAEN